MRSMGKIERREYLTKRCDFCGKSIPMRKRSVEFMVDHIHSSVPSACRQGDDKLEILYFCSEVCCTLERVDFYKNFKKKRESKDLNQELVDGVKDFAYRQIQYCDYAKRKGVNGMAGYKNAILDVLAAIEKIENEHEH